MVRPYAYVEAAEIVLVIDACHAAASIQEENFKPGPLGSRGLGQLAYDKRMRVLAASQTNQNAEEIGGQIEEGILTYALLHDGILARQAIDGENRITLDSWLAYPITRVPRLFDEMRTGKINDFGMPILRDATLKIDTGKKSLRQPVQVPALFNFKKTAGAIVDLSR
jgi:hypothetical protein